MRELLCKRGLPLPASPLWGASAKITMGGRLPSRLNWSHWTRNDSERSQNGWRPWECVFDRMLSPAQPSSSSW